MKSYRAHDSYVLKTDLWNEGVERDRDLAVYVRKASGEATLVGIDISRTVCEYANEANQSGIEIVRSTLLSAPFQAKFDFIMDVSTVDHIPERMRTSWIRNESSLLNDNGILMISFDSRLNLACELFHRLFTRKLYPEWTLLPAHVRLQLSREGFKILEEHAIFTLGLFFGTHRPWFPLSRLLSRRAFLNIMKRIELSRNSKLLSFLAPQYVIVAMKRLD